MGVIDCPGPYVRTGCVGVTEVDITRFVPPQEQAGDEDSGVKPLEAVEMAIIRRWNSGGSVIFASRTILGMQAVSEIL